ncbi:MAG: DUF4038 domain-containing protein [Verrucomicrobia bacterium]|nr:DUF4038 domain-containing protein [Verrucomicrobiota bacterium]
MNVKTQNSRSRAALGFLLSSFTLACFVASGAEVPKYGRFEQSFQSSAAYDNPVQKAALTVTFTPPKGDPIKVPGFWDGGPTWRVRFAPNQTGAWSFTTTCSDAANTGLHQQSGSFTCVEAKGATRFEQHGPVRVSADGFYLQHDDGTPFFFLSDTAWNGALLSTEADWSLYLKERSRQKFSAVQWVATPWRAAPDGDLDKQLAFTGKEKIEINPKFFQRLDAKADAVSKAGLLNVPVLLWAIGSGKNPAVNPGWSLPEDQAILLARYMVARWQANAVVWILPGDGHYFGTEGDKWKRIGRAVFGDIAHAPVSLHPQGRHWNWPEFQGEQWLNLIGYQSGHGDSDDHLRWLTEGPVTKDWKNPPHRPFINLEPPYEGHLGYQSKKPISADLTRRTIYWSLLNAPTAGVSYGGHGVWGWDDGTKPPTDHAGAGIPLPWQKALTMPAAEQMTNLVAFFTAIDFAQLRPKPECIVNNPGAQNPRKYIAAAGTVKNDVLLVYVPEDRTVEVLLESLPPSPEVRWWNPRTGEKSAAVGVVTEKTCQFPTPAEGDWVLVMQTQEKKGK